MDHDDHNGEDHSHDSDHSDGHHRHHELMFKKKFWVSLLLSLPVLAYSEFVQANLGFSMPAFTGSSLIVPVFSIIVFIYGGLPFLKMARGELDDSKPGMMTLISLGILVAFIYSLVSLFIQDTATFFWELVTLIDVMLLGHWIEMRSVRQASGALDQLASLMPDTAELITEDGNTETVKASELSESDKVLVRPGATIPADGKVVKGSSHVNESMITGESEPVSKEPGDKAVGGTLNQDGSLHVEITATGDDTTLSGIMRLVEEAQEGKTETQLLADRAAGWLFYVALGTAAITALIWTIAIGFNITTLERIVTVLVIACPHALGLAIPLVVAITTSISAKNGILIRDRTAMETVLDVDTVLMDKTGTLTEGKQQIIEIETTEATDKETAISQMAAAEQDSEHMIAQAVRTKADDLDIEPPEAHNFQAIKGKGVTATINGETIHVGGPNLINELNTTTNPLKQFAETQGTKGRTVIYLIKNNSIVAAASLADKIRDESYRAVETLHDRGISVAMITGDSQEVAQSVADELGIDRVFAEVLPEDKDDKVQQLQDEDNTVMMVGDGINDAPALVRADIGVAIGSGTDVAIESADIILVSDSPGGIIKLFDIGKASYSKMQQNLVWATGYNVIALPVAAGILVPWGISLQPAVGALIMSLSTVIVAINAQLLHYGSL